MQRYFLIIGLLIGLVTSAMGQAPVITNKKTKADSLQEKRDSLKSKPFVPKITTEKVYHPDSTHSPTKAWHRSVFVPGWGQVYNRQYWKVPVIYTGLTLLVVMYKFNQTEYNTFLALAKYQAKGTQPGIHDPYYKEYNDYLGTSPATVTDAVRGYARYRDLSVLLFAAAWGIQTIDAYIDAKFKHSYSMDTNFNVKVTPTVIDGSVGAQSLAGAFIPGLKVTFALR